MTEVLFAIMWSCDAPQYNKKIKDLNIRRFAQTLYPSHLCGAKQQMYDHSYMYHKVIDQPEYKTASLASFQ